MHVIADFLKLSHYDPFRGKLTLTDEAGLTFLRPAFLLRSVGELQIIR